MFKDIATAKDFASKLAQVLTATGTAPAPTHSEALELVSKMAGEPNWQTFRAQLIRAWSYNRHAPYLPNSVEVVKALSVRKAVFDATATRTADEDAQGYPFVHSLRAALVQIESVKSGGWRVEPELEAAIKASTLYSLQDLLTDVHAAKTSYRAFTAVKCVKPLDGVDIERYQQRYTAWRLAEFALAFRRYQEASPATRFATLVGSGVDLYAYVALFLEGKLSAGSPALSADALYDMSTALRKEDPNARYYAKTAVLEYLCSGTAEYAKLNEGLYLPQWGSRDIAASFSQISTLFPELDVWHVWVELKSLFAAGIDKSTS